MKNIIMLVIALLGFTASAQVTTDVIDGVFVAGHYTIYNSTCDIVDDSDCYETLMLTPQGNICASFLGSEVIYVTDSICDIFMDEIYEYRVFGVAECCKQEVMIGINEDFIDIEYKYFTIRYWNNRIRFSK